MAKTNAIIIYETGPNPPAVHDWSFAGGSPYGYGFKLWIHEPDWTLCLGYRCYPVPAAALWISAVIFALVLLLAVRRVIYRRHDHTTA